nr:oligosaccharide flippase family protein [candidate division Zixibacteria bacterium]
MENPKRLLLKNIVSNWASMAVSVVIGFFLSPFLVHNLGKAEYGILALVMSIITYTEFFDVGMRQSLARYLPKYYALKDYLSLNKLVNSSGMIYTAIATLTVIGTIVIVVFFVEFFKVPEMMVNVMKITLIIMGVNQAFNFLIMPWTALGPFHRYDLLNGTNIAKSILSALVTVYFISKGYGIVTIAVITIIFSFLSGIVRERMQHSIVPEIRFKIGYIEKGVIRQLLDYGIISFLIVVSTIVIFSTDNIVVGFFLSATAVTYFSIAGTLITHLRMLVNSIGVPLVPAISHLDASSNLDEISALYEKLTKYLYYLTISICLGILIFGRQFIYLWMGPDFDQTVTILYILVVPATIYLPQMMANSVLLGIGRLRPLLYILVSEALSNIILSVILVQIMGIYGVAWGTAIPQLIIYIFIYPRVFYKAIQGNLKKFYLNSLKMILSSVIFTLPVGLSVSRFIRIEGWLGFFINISITGVFIFAGFVMLVLSPEDRGRIFRGKSVKTMVSNKE